MNFIKKILFAKNSIAIYAASIIIINLILLTFPLTNIFGFEFSAINSMLLVLLSGIYVIQLLKKESATVLNFKSIKINLPITGALFLLIPAVISVSHSIYTSSCPLKDGVLFYVILTFPSIVIGIGLGLICIVFVNHFRILSFVILYLLILSIPLFEFYFNPQVYFFNPIFGYYPGTIYDVAINISFKLVGYRILNLLFFGTIAAYSLFIILSKKKIHKNILFIFVLIIAVLFIYFSPMLGYSTTFNKLNSVLNEEVETPHFIIHYPSGLDKKLTKVISLYHEYYYSKLKGFFKYDLTRKINSYIFLNSEQKGKLFGSRNADVAKPWQYATYITYDDYNTTLKHEMAHVFSVKFGKGIFKVAKNLNPSLIEGIAMAADPIYNDNTIDYMAALAYKYGFKVSLQNLYSGFNFFGQTSSLSYIYAGAFTQFLIREYGIEKFKELYADINFQKVYGRTIKQLSTDFFVKLDSINVTGKNDEAYYYFGRKSIFYKVCPRYVASKLSNAWDEYSQKDFIKAKNMFTEILKTTNNYSALIGMASSLEKLNQRKNAIDLLQSKISDYKSSAYYYNIEFRLADIFAASDKKVKADSIYHKIVEQNPNRTLYNLSNLRLNLSYKDSLLQIYLKSNDFNKFIILSQLDSTGFNYYALPAAINLWEMLHGEYSIFVKNYYSDFKVNDYAGSYAMFKLSQYMVEKLDFKRAQKIAALAINYSGDKNFDEILANNYEIIEWLNSNASRVLSEFRFRKFQKQSLN